MLGRNKPKGGESEPGNKESHGARRVLRKATGVVGVVAVAAGAGVALANEKTLEKYTDQEAALIEAQRRDTPQCINGVFLLRSGVAYRETPHIKNSKLLLILKGNVADKVGEDQELPIGRPLQYVDGKENTWLGFTLDKSPGQGSPGRIMSSREVADKTNWVNYSEYEGSMNTEGEGYIGVYPDGSAANTMGCDITVEGQIMAEGEPAAYGSPNAEGVFARIMRLPGLNPEKAD